MADNEYVEGVDEVNRLLDFVFGLLTGSALTEGFLAAARILAATARSYAPVRTGYLKSLIGVEQEGFDVYLVAKAVYSAFVEFGTKRMAARPFIRPALESAAGAALTALGRTLQAALERIF